MKEYPNFYENMKEARMRINNTVVMYDGAPFFVLAIGNNKEDGIFRVYLQPLWMREAYQNQQMEMMKGKKINPKEKIELPDPDSILHQYPPSAGDKPLGDYMDEWLKLHPESPILRRKMNSPKFNKFRPFPLGMCNWKGDVFYLARQPVRNREQGLTPAMLVEKPVCPESKVRDRRNVDIHTKAGEDCILARHPSAREAYDNLCDPEIINTGVAFHREFAFIRGPMGMVFLVYKSDTIGLLLDDDFGSVKIGKDFHHTKEVVENLNLFGSIVLQK